MMTTTRSVQSSGGGKPEKTADIGVAAFGLASNKLKRGFAWSPFRLLEHHFHPPVILLASRAIGLLGPVPSTSPYQGQNVVPGRWGTSSLHGAFLEQPAEMAR
jgi:hypothetical protein